MTLASLIRANEWSKVDAAWAEIMGSDAPIDEVLAALDVAAETKHLTKTLPFVREYAELLEAAERYRDAAEVLGKALLLGGPPGELSTRLFRCALAGWGQEPYWADYSRLVQFHESTGDVRKAWRGLRSLIHLGKGSAVFHRSGWGVGEVLEVDLGKLEAQIRFASGRRDWFPIKTVLDTCDVLDSDDLRGLVVKDRAELERRLKDDALGVLVSVAKRYGGKIKQNVLKSAMAQLGLDQAAFTSWWRKARKAAETSNYVEVTGSGINSQVRILDNEVDPGESMRRQLRMSRDLGAALTRVRDLFAGKLISPTLREAALATLEEMVSTPDSEEVQRLATWLFLRNERGTTPPALSARLEAAKAAPLPGDPGITPPVWALFERLGGSRDQELAIDLLPEIYGETWLDEVAKNLMHAAPGMARGLVDSLLNAGKSAVLAEYYQSLLIRPTRNSHLLVAIAELAESGRFQGHYPSPLQRLHSFLLLAHNLFVAEGADPQRQRTQQRLTQLLTSGEPTLLRVLLTGAKRNDVRALMPLIAKGVDGAVDRAFTHVAVSLFPNIYRDEARPFWEEDAIWTSRVGLMRREAELKDLRESKIPANSEAIGRAASYGDLSENSEWEAAIEEQRNLTARAMEIEEELRKAQLIENAAIPAKTVAPGTSARYRVVASGKENFVRILGPWDSEGEQDISYRSPVAQGMLGKHEGERAILRLPTGEQEIEVLAVEILPLGTPVGAGR
jgi:transcription elongation GreA/GreB family factor